MDALGIHRPRNVGWKRAAALLYGDLGTSKAYVIGLAFFVAGYASLPIVVAVSALTGLVAYNYAIISKYFPDGGGVYSAARDQSRMLAVIGALLLIADFTVTSALNAWSALEYFHVPRAYIGLVSMVLVLGIALTNMFGPKHTGSLAVVMAVPMVIVVIGIIFLSLPYLSLANLEPSHTSFRKNWVSFTGVILALSGIEAIANLTGVLRLDPGATMEKPRVAKTAGKAIFAVAVEVTLGTALLGWAMLSLPRTPELVKQLHTNWEDMLRLLGEHYGTLVFGSVQAGQVLGVVIGLIVGLLLLSAVNTAVAATIGALYLMARDGEMPRSFAKLNPFGVPWLPMAAAAALPLVVLMFTDDMAFLTNLYAIGVVGAITVNLGSCAFNARLPLRPYERISMGVSFLILLAVEITIAYTKHEALFFASCVLVAGMGLRGWAQRRAGLRTITVSKEIAAHVDPESVPDFRLSLNPGQIILVAARGMTPVLRFALEEARLRQGSLYVLFVKELAVALPGPLHKEERPRWQDDGHAAKIMYAMLSQGKQNEVPVVPVYAVSDDPATTILDLAATLGIDILMLGAPQRSGLSKLLKGNVVGEVARHLPENIQLVIHS